MKILFDSQIFDWQLNGGISRYFIEVIQRLEKDTEILFEVNHSYNTYIQHTHWLKHKPVLKKLNFKRKLGTLKIINEKINRPYSNRLLKKTVPDIFHPTYYNPYFLQYLGKTPLVLTVYDLTNEKFADNSSLTKKMLDWKRKLILAADHIISISENTKKDIVEYYKINPEKITTIYLSSGFDISVKKAARVKEMDLIPGKYILFVGSRSRYKNFLSFLKEAVPVIKEKDIYLVTAGGSNFLPEEIALIKEELDIGSKLISFPHVSDTFLAQLYSKALLFVFPSLYEGFGLPVLEAMQCECPVLLSNNSSLPEVGGDSAAYFDPFTEGSLQKAITGLLEDVEKRKQMKLSGLEQIKKFNWEATAIAHKAVYKKVMR